jgi:hypothetical protein
MASRNASPSDLPSRARVSGRVVARGALGGAALAWVLPVLAASCGASNGGAATDGGAERDAAGADVSVAASDGSPAPDGTTSAPSACPVRAGLRAACDGSDPKVVFYPPLACDPKNLDASAGDGGDSGNPCAAVGPSDVSFTSAACGAFVDAQTSGKVSVETSGRTPVFTEPANGDALTADEWSIFAWQKGPQARRSPVLELIEPEAHALTPLAGDGYVLVFSQSCNEILRVMVASTFWAPDPASWTTLATLQGPVTVQVFWAKFAQDGIASGPVASAPISITMKQ